MRAVARVGGRGGRWRGCGATAQWTPCYAAGGLRWLQAQAQGSGGAASCHVAVSCIRSVICCVELPVRMKDHAVWISQSSRKHFHAIRTIPGDRVSVDLRVVSDETIESGLSQVCHQRRGREKVLSHQPRGRQCTWGTSVGVTADVDVQFTAIACKRSKKGPDCVRMWKGSYVTNATGAARSTNRKIFRSPVPRRKKGKVVSYSKW